DDGQLYAQASIDLDERGRELAAETVAQHLASKGKESTEGAAESSKVRGSATSLGAVDEHCRTLAPRRNGGAFILYLRALSPLSEKRAEILNALVGCARLALQAIDLRT